MDEIKNRRLLNFSIYSHIEPHQKQFNIETTFLSELFYRLLRKYKYQSPYNYISFSFGKEPGEMIGSNIYRKTYDIDLKDFYQIDIDERKWMIFDIVYKGLTLITTDKTSLELLSKIYDECSKNGLRNEWYLKDKYFRSPDRNRHIGIWCVWKEEVELYIHIFNKDKETIIHKELYLKIPSHRGEYIYGLNPRWTDLDTFYLDYSDDGLINGSKKIGDIEILV